MAILVRRDGEVRRTLGSYVAPGASYLVTAYEPGAIVASASTGTTATVDLGHGFAANDKFIVVRSGSYVSGSFNTVSAVTATTLTITAASLSVGDVLVNLGPDTGVTSPNYDGSGLTIYSDADGSTAITNEVVTADSGGNYSYYHTGSSDIWELIRSNASTPVYALPGAYQGSTGGAVSYGKRYIHLYATGGLGTPASPWTGWESGVVDGAQNHFIAGYFGTATGLAVALANNNGPGKFSLTGEGMESSFIVATADVQALRIYASNGSPATCQPYIANLSVITNIANTQAGGMVSFEGFDTQWSVKNLAVRNRNAANDTNYTVTLGLRFLNCQCGVVDNLWIRSFSTEDPGFTTGLFLTANDSAQRGNIVFLGGQISQCDTAVKIDTTSSGGTNNLSGICFYGTKLLHGTTGQAGTKGFDCESAADTLLLSNVHIERYQTAIELDGANGVTIIGGLISRANDIDSGTAAGNAILVGNTTACTGVLIANCTIANSYSGVTIGATASQRVTYIRGHIDTIGAGGEWTDNSTAAVTSGTNSGNMRIDGNVFPEGVTVKQADAGGVALRIWNTDSSNSEASPRITFRPGGASQASLDSFIHSDSSGNVQILNDSSVIIASFLQSLGWRQYTANSGEWRLGQASENLTLSTGGTTTDTSASLLPANSIIEAVVARVTTTITTATNWALGDSAQSARFLTATTDLTSGTTKVGLNHADPTVASSNLGPVQSSAAPVRVTTTGTPGAGAIRITVFYRQFVAPTS
jgi:hypothetical protein